MIIRPGGLELVPVRVEIGLAGLMSRTHCSMKCCYVGRDLACALPICFPCTIWVAARAVRPAVLAGQRDERRRVISRQTDAQTPAAKAAYDARCRRVIACVNPHVVCASCSLPIIIIIIKCHQNALVHSAHPIRPSPRPGGLR